MLSGKAELLETCDIGSKADSDFGEGGSIQGPGALLEARNAKLNVYVADLKNAAYLPLTGPLCSLQLPGSHPAPQTCTS